MSRRIADVVQEPLTGLTKVLLVEVLILLLISSVFIGLFAGAQHKLNLRNGTPGGGGGGGGGNTTLTETATATVTHTTTAASTKISGIVTTTTAVSTTFSTVYGTTTATKIATTTSTKTSVSTSVSTSTYTTTDVHTRTVIVGPEPTGPPENPSPPAPPSVGQFTCGRTVSYHLQDKCLTPNCIILAASILSSLDTSQDPCENFYDFASKSARGFVSCPLHC